MRKFKTVFMRGGTSKGCMFHKEDLPEDRKEWDNIFLLYRKDRLRRSFELKMPAGRRATQIDDLGIKKDKNLPH